MLRELQAQQQKRAALKNQPINSMSLAKFRLVSKGNTVPKKLGQTPTPKTKPKPKDWNNGF